MATPEEVRDRIKIEDMIGQKVRLKRSGSVLRGLCPFHNEKTPSFTVTPSRQRYMCFGCGATGDCFEWVQRTQWLTFPEALEELAKSVGLEVTREQTAEDRAREEVERANMLAAIYYQHCLREGLEDRSMFADVERAMAYLHQRAIGLEAAERFGMGVAPSQGGLLMSFMRDNNWTREQVERAGLAVAGQRGVSRDMFRGRLMIPVRDARGRVLGFGARSLDGSEPKYLNSPQTPAFEKGKTLFGIDLAQEAIRKEGCAVVVEGFFDAIRAHQEGFTNVVASQGTAVTVDQIAQLARLAPRIILALDGDAAGQKAALRAGLAVVEALGWKAGKDWLDVRIAVLPPGDDPDSLIRKSPPAWRNRTSGAGSTPILTHYIATLGSAVREDDPASKQAVLDQALPYIRKVPGVALQRGYYQHLSDVTGVPLERLDGSAYWERAGTRVSRSPHARASIPTLPDPTRTAEEFLLGQLLHLLPLGPEMRACLEGFWPSCDDLEPYFAYVIHGLAVDETLLEPYRRKGALVPVANRAMAVRSCLEVLRQRRRRREVEELGRGDPLAALGRMRQLVTGG